MSPENAGLAGLAILFLLLVLRMPIAFALGLVGFIGFGCVVGFQQSLAILGMTPFDTTSTYALSVVALFVLMGQFVSRTGLAEDAYSTVHKWMGHLPGGIAMATIGACAAFAAVSGSSLATGATLGAVSLPEMKRFKYKSSLATGAIAAGGTLGILIPPSVILVFYGIIAEQSIGKLFLAGFIPGFLLAILFMLYIYLVCRFTIGASEIVQKASLRDRIGSLKKTWGVLLLFLVVMGGIYSGIFTPTEAGGIGAFGALIFALIRKKMTWKNFFTSLRLSVETTTMLLIIIIGASLFTYFMAVTNIPTLTAEFVVSLGLPGYLVISIIVLIYLLLGCFLDSFGMITLTIPIFLPTILTLGYDPIWFGVMIVIVCEAGLITPPLGLNVYVISGVAKDVPMYTIFKGVTPFLLMMILLIALLIAFPDIALFLPNLMMN